MKLILPVFVALASLAAAAPVFDVIDDVKDKVESYEPKPDECEDKYDDGHDDHEWDDDHYDVEIPKWYGHGKDEYGHQKPSKFDYKVQVKAVPGQVVDSENVKTGGLKDSWGLYALGFIKEENVVCYHIIHYNWRGAYESAAKTATHLHEAKRGQSGPPRIAFPNPTGPNKKRSVAGCMKGPFRTGLPDTETGEDTGKGFHVKEILEHPAWFNVDAHSSKAVPGAFRGQLPKKH